MYYQKSKLKRRSSPCSGSGSPLPMTTADAHLLLSRLKVTTSFRAILIIRLGCQKNGSLIGLESRSMLSYEFCLHIPAVMNESRSAISGLSYVDPALILRPPNFGKDHGLLVFLQDYACNRRWHCSIFSKASLQPCEHYPF